MDKMFSFYTNPGINNVKTAEKMFSVHTNPDKFENEPRFDQKRIKCFPSTLIRIYLKTQRFYCRLMIIVTSAYSKSFKFEKLSVHTNTKKSRVQIAPL